jgi:hypothetical protein
MEDLNITPITHISTATERQPMCIQRRKRQMSLVGSYTQDRSIKREDGMEKGSFGVGMEISTLVSGRVAAAQMVSGIDCKMTAYTICASTQMVKEEILLALDILMFEIGNFYILFLRLLSSIN